MKQVLVYAVISIAITTGLYGCGEDAPVGASETIYIEGYKDSCVENDAQLCIVARREGDSRSILLYQPVIGLEYEWGRRQIVKVVKEGDRYRVVEVLDAVQESFDRGFILEISAAAITHLGNCVFGLANEVKFSLAAPRLCRQLNSFIDNGGERFLQFSYTGSSVVPIRLDSIGNTEGSHSE